VPAMFGLQAVALHTSAGARSLSSAIARHVCRDSHAWYPSPPR
jgi:hypothetical protein